MRTLALILVSLGLAFGQSQKPSNVDDAKFYSATSTLSLSGAGGAVTLQVPASTGKTVYLQSVTITSSVDLTIAQEKDGSTATATAVTPVLLNGTSGTPVATFYTGSNTTGGSTVPPVNVKAGISSPIDMSFTAFRRGVSAVQNFTWRVPTTTATVTFGIVWGEK